MSQNGSVQQQTEGSRTISLEEIPPVLQLRAPNGREAHQQSSSTKSQRPKVRWQSDVIDNENMNKKKTKICCIFHPQQEFSDDEFECSSNHDHSSNSSSSSSSSESDNEKGLTADERRQRRVVRRHQKLQQNKSRTPNAYEIQPDYTHQHDRNSR